MPRYEFKPIEARWQAFWERNETFRTPDPGDPGFDPSRPKFYVLDMFPYPSGAGLHVGHPKGYTATDILARFQRMRGFQVLHPIGWDAFGLPAEQYAIQTGTHPAVTTARNVANFKRQLKELGLSYDWSREISTTDPGYYRWTQWIFEKLHEKGLAYQAEVPVWWCQALGTVLANEEVINGRSERGDHPCVRKPLRQWMLKITAYAERLLEGLDDLDWPESVKAMQREWIGRSEGAEIEFQVASFPECDEHLGFTVFTTRQDTLFGATFCTLAPEHPLVEKITTSEKRAEVEAYVRQAARKSDMERRQLVKEKTGVFTGAFACNPVFPEGDPRRKIPIYISDYVLLSYGTGAVMAVPGSDERDFEFAGSFGIPIRTVVVPEGEPPPREPACFSGEGILVNSGWLDGLSVPEARKKMNAWLEEQGCGRPKVTYRLRDWLFSRQRYWGEPFPVLHGPEGQIRLVPEEELPVELPELDRFLPSPDGSPPLSRAADWVRVADPETGRIWMRETNSMPQWAGSCWYYLRFCDPRNPERPWDPEKERYWMPVDFYVGGAEHAVLHLLYARFWHKVLYDCGLVSTPEPFQKLINQGMVLAYAYRDGRGALVPADEVEVRGEEDLVRRSDGERVEPFVAKMSKSLRNVVSTETVVREFGADTMRLYEAFMGPVEASGPWNPRALPGVHRFLQRVWRLLVPEEEDSPPLHPHLGKEDRPGDPEIERALHRAIAKVGEDVPRLANNTAIAALMEFVNTATRRGGRLNRSQAERLTLILAPFAPHLAEELWNRLGHDQSLARHPWPEHDPSMLVDDQVEIPVQVNGKVRARILVAPDADTQGMEDLARKAVSERLKGREVRKVIVVPGRMVNLVVA